MTNPPTPSPTTIAEQWWSGLDRIWIFRVCRMNHLRPNSGHAPWVISAVIAFAITFVLPVGADLSLSGKPLVSTHTDGGLVALLLTCTLSFTILICAGFGWATLARRMLWLDRMCNPGTRLQVVNWFDRLFFLQFTGLITSSALLVLAFLLVPRAWAFLPSNILSWVSVGELLVIAGSVLYFAIAVPGILTRFVRGRRRSLRLFKLDPAATPGLRLLADMVTLSSIFLLIAMLFLTGLAFYVRYSNHELPAYMQSSLPIMAAVIFVLLVRIALVPTIQLHWIVLRDRTERMHVLNSQLVRIDAELARRAGEPVVPAERRLLVEEFALLAKADNLPFRAESVAQFAAATIGSLVAFVLLWIFGNPPT